MLQFIWCQTDERGITDCYVIERSPWLKWPLTPSWKKELLEVQWHRLIVSSLRYWNTGVKVIMFCQFYRAPLTIKPGLAVVTGRHWLVKKSWPRFNGGFTVNMALWNWWLVNWKLSVCDHGWIMVGWGVESFLHRPFSVTFKQKQKGTSNNNNIERNIILFVCKVIAFGWIKVLIFYGDWLHQCDLSENYVFCVVLTCA